MEGQTLATLAKRGLAMISKEERKERKRRERERADLTRGSQLARLLMRQVIDRRRFEAGAIIRQLYIQSAAGVSAVDFTRERVDGGKHVADQVQIGMLHAERELKRVLEKSGMGDDAAYVVLAVAGCDISLTALALHLEENEKWRAAGRPSRDAQHIASYLLRTGLGKAADALRVGTQRRFHGGDFRDVSVAPQDGPASRIRAFISR